MPQNNFFVPMQAGLALVTAGGAKWTQIGVATVIKATPGRLAKVVIITAGGTGSWTFNDCATLADANAANAIATIAYNATGLVAGLPLTFEWPCLVGIVCSLVPASGTPLANISFA